MVLAVVFVYVSFTNILYIQQEPVDRNFNWHQLIVIQYVLIVRHRNTGGTV